MLILFYAFKQEYYAAIIDGSNAAKDIIE